VLASASPRRRRLLAWLGVPYQVTATDVDETIDPALTAEELALELAARKARAVASGRLGPAHGDRAEDEMAGSIVVACDTLVVLDGEILGKPADLSDAYRMLHALSGLTHEVVTGVALLGPEAAEPRTRCVTTKVAMRDLTPEDIDAWAEAGELLGCAGAYNIERHLATVSLDECFQNVAGLPLCHLYGWLRRGADGPVPDGLTSPLAACDAARGVTCRLGRKLTGGD
jgi:septum formation protein